MAPAWTAAWTAAGTAAGTARTGRARTAERERTAARA